MNLLSPEQIAALRQAVRLAPTADNRAGYALALDVTGCGNMAPVRTDDTELGRRTLDALSLGAAMENLRIRASQWGYAPAIAPDLLDAHGRVSIRFKLLPTHAPPDALDAVLERRCSNRRLRFRGPAIVGTQRSHLLHAIGQVPGASLHWLDDARQRQTTLGLVRRAEAERYRNQALHQELYASLQRRTGRGMPADTGGGIARAALEMSLWERVGFDALSHWRWQQLANRLGMHHFISLRAAYWPCLLAPQLGVIAAEGELAQAGLAAGRLLQRTWLAATQSGLAFQVFAASALLALTETRGIDAGLQRTLRQGWQRVLPGARPLLVFRMGYAAAPTARSVHPTWAGSDAL